MLTFAPPFWDVSARVAAVQRHSTTFTHDIGVGTVLQRISAGRDPHLEPYTRSLPLRRSQLPETPRFTSEIERDVVKAKSNMTAVFNKNSKQYSDEGRITANEQDRCVHSLRWCSSRCSGCNTSYSLL